MEPSLWPSLSVASALLPLIRRELQDAEGAPRDRSVALDVCAIVEDGLFGYELAPQDDQGPFLIVGCTEDNIPRLRRTSFDPNGTAGLRLATIAGRRINAARPHLRRPPRQAESLFADWPTAAAHAWQTLAPALAREGPHWHASMQTCRALENALTVAGLHLAQWDPTVEFCGLMHQATYGLPLRGREGGSGTLTMKSAETWLLYWKADNTVIRHEFSAHAQSVMPRGERSRDASG